MMSPAFTEAPALIFDGFAYIDGDLIAFPDVIAERVVLDEEKSVVDRVAEKDPGIGACDDRADAERLDDFRSLLTGGAAAEVLAGHNDVAGLYLSGQLRP